MERVSEFQKPAGTRVVALRQFRSEAGGSLQGTSFEDNDWRHKLASLGYWRATVLITLFCVLISAPVRMILFMGLWHEHGELLLREMLVSSAVPAFIVPIAVYWFMRLLYDLEAARAKLLQAATIDAVTQINNRNYFVTRFALEVTRAQREHTPLALALIDLDHFKNINDSLGHTAGDLVLKDVAQAIRGVVRPYDVVARYGGDEFVLLMPGITTSHACAIADRIRDTVACLDVHGSQSALKTTVSVGISSLAAREDGGSFMERADAALYQAKQTGRNRWVCAANPTMTAR